MKKNNFKTDLKLNAEKMLFLLPKSCNCSTCNATKDYVKNAIGESEFVSMCKQAGVGI